MIKPTEKEFEIANALVEQLGGMSVAKDLVSNCKSPRNEWIFLMNYQPPLNRRKYSVRVISQAVSIIENGYYS